MTTARIVRARCSIPVSVQPGAFVDFDEQDIHEWAMAAQKQGRWQVVCFPALIESVVVVASPDGRAAVWFGCLPCMHTETEDYPQHGWYGRNCLRLQTPSMRTAAEAALSREPEGKAAARYWGARRLGSAEIRPLALAALRVLHARAFGDPLQLRDQLLASFALAEPRPTTKRLLRATDDELLAANALIGIKDFEGACALLQKGAKRGEV
jgi:hypothetical protein